MGYEKRKIFPVSFWQLQNTNTGKSDSWPEKNMQKCTDNLSEGDSVIRVMPKKTKKEMKHMNSSEQKYNFVLIKVLNPY